MRKRFFLPVFVFLFFFIAGAAIKAMAATQGWIWGGSEDANISGSMGVRDGNETGAGKISVSSANTDSAIDYGINIPPNDDPVTGYAWSENLGWISFNAADLTGCPDGNCVAKRTGNNLEGWARIIGIKNQLAVGNSGGWQGFIKLKGTTTGGESYGIQLNPDGTIKKCSNGVSCAWNGEEPGTGNNKANGLGWLDFSGVTADATRKLAICQDSCTTGSLVNEIIVMEGNNKQNIKACWTSSPMDCRGNSSDTNDVTAPPTTWTPADITIANTYSSGEQYAIEGKKVGSTSVAVNYIGNLASFNVQVKDNTCTSDNCTLEESKKRMENTCRNSMAADDCGNYKCPGIKDCAGWWEEGPR